MTVSLTPGGAIQGISFAASTEGTAYGQLNASSLHLPLTDTLVPARGTSAPTFTRATSAWVFDNEGKLNLNVPSGCARFTGARLVRNLLSASEDLNSASWTKTNLTVTSGQADPDGGTSAWKVEAASSAPITFYQGSPAGTNAKTYTYSFYVKKGSGELDANKFYLYDTTATVNVLGVTINYDTGAITYFVGSTGVTVTSAQNGFWRVEMRADAVTQGNPLRCYTFFTGAVETGGEFAYFYHPQLENVSGQANQTASEYISNGVLSAPWHGAGVDGCKWFPTNKDGSAISASTLEGYLPEPVRTNNCLYSRALNTFSNSSMSTVRWKIANDVGSSVVVNGDFSSGLTGWNVGASGGDSITESGGVVNIISVGGACSMSQATGLVIGKTYTVTIVINSGTGTIKFTSSPVEVTLIGVGTSVFNFQASSTGFSLARTVGVNCNLFVESVTIKEAAIQVTTATGIDNVANSASRLTAAANDATIMQLLTAATGTRTLSAYIKRISGSGTISLTRNGGTNWTDITSSLVTDSWVLVQMTSDVGANPTVGIKMGTSGDVIDVDCVQDENGAWRTSPILTTTAAVTRNADALSYASAFDVAQGTVLCSLRSDVPVGSGSEIYALSSESTARFVYWASTRERTSMAAYDSTTIISANTGSSINTGIRKRGVRWGADFLACSDGVIGTAGAFDGSMGSSAILRVGCDSSGGSQLSGPIREVHIWSTPLTDAQMQQVTS